jgi:transcription antitermination factor NusG
MKASEELRLGGYQAYLPRRRLEKFNRQQRVLSIREEPLMKGYLFMAEPADWGKLRDEEKFSAVVGPLKGSEGPLEIRAGEVAGILFAEMDLQFDDTDEARRYRGELEATYRLDLEKLFAPGTLMPVLSGPFASFAATVEALTPHDQVKALVNIFGRLVPVTFDAADLSNNLPKRPSAGLAA